MTKQERELLARYIAQHTEKPHREIAALVGVSQATIRNVVAEYGHLIPNLRRLPVRPKSIAQILSEADAAEKANEAL